MRVSLVPDRLFETYEEITPEYLRQRGIRLLLSDLDYTLAPKYVPHPDDRVREWLRRMEEGGVQVMILSNNRSSHRVETFCRELGIPYVAFLGEDEIAQGSCTEAPHHGLPPGYGAGRSHRRRDGHAGG